MGEDKSVVRNAADEEQVKKAAEKEKSGRELEIADLTWLLGQAQFRRFIWGLFEFAGIFKSSFTGNSSTFYNEGQRNVGLKYLADVMETDPNAFIQMLQDAKKNIDSKPKGK